MGSQESEASDRNQGLFLTGYHLQGEVVSIDVRPTDAGRRGAEMVVLPGSTCGQVENGRVVVVENPPAVLISVAKEIGLVRVVLVHRRISVQVIGSQVGHHADVGAKSIDTCELE